jgi:membrane protein implicated in regulation of membrane protease activity
MLRTILVTGVMVMLGIFALGFVFKIFGGLIALTFLLLGFAFKALLIGGVAYLIIRIVSPDTARRLRDRWSGTRIDRY